MSRNLQIVSRWAGRVSAGIILLLGLFWTWFGVACAWPDPLGMLMHTLIPGLPLVGLGLICWWQPAAGGVVLTLWGASPLLVLIGSRPFFNYHGQWFTMTPVLVYWLPLLLGIVMIWAGAVRSRAELEKEQNENQPEG